MKYSEFAKHSEDRKQLKDDINAKQSWGWEFFFEK